jgi:hypothetical protein
MSSKVSSSPSTPTRSAQVAPTERSHGVPFVAAAVGLGAAAATLLTAVPAGAQPASTHLKSGAPVMSALHARLASFKIAPADETRAQQLQQAADRVNEALPKPAASDDPNTAHVGSSTLNLDASNGATFTNSNTSVNVRQGVNGVDVSATQNVTGSSANAQVTTGLQNNQGYVRSSATVTSGRTTVSAQGEINGNGEPTASVTASQRVGIGNASSAGVTVTAATGQETNATADIDAQLSPTTRVRANASTQSNGLTLVGASASYNNGTTSVDIGAQRSGDGVVSVNGAASTRITPGTSVGIRGTSGPNGTTGSAELTTDLGNGFSGSVRQGLSGEGTEARIQFTK